MRMESQEVYPQLWIHLLAYIRSEISLIPEIDVSDFFLVVPEILLTEHIIWIYFIVALRQRLACQQTLCINQYSL